MPRVAPVNLHRAGLWVVVCAGVLLFAAACTGSQQAPAQEAIADVEAVLRQAGTGPAKYIPGELKDVQADLAVLKQDYERGEFGAVVERAPAVLTRALALAPAAAARETELLETLREEWRALEASLPAELAAITDRFERATAEGRRPAGRTAAEVGAARDRLRDALALWDRARQEAGAGRLPEAVTLAHQVRSMGRAVDAVSDPGAASTPVE